MITKETRLKIKGYLEGFIQGMIDEMTDNGFDPKQLRPMRSASKSGDLKPFHESLLPDGILKITEFERSFSTKMGTTFEECARLIALDNHKHAERGYRVRGKASFGSIKRIEEIINEVGNGGMKKSFPYYVEQVLSLANDKDSEERKNIADLYILKNDDTKMFFEIKSPKPNKGQCLEATARLLQIHAMLHESQPSIKCYYATGYNPYGVEKETYKHSFALNYMDIENEVLLGKEFWDLVGNQQGTYEEILSIYQEVGKEKGPKMLDQLALGY